MVYETPKGTTTLIKVESAAPGVLTKLKLAQDRLELKLSDRRWPAILDAIESGTLRVQVLWFHEPIITPSAWYKIHTPTEFVSLKRPPRNAAIGYIHKDLRNVASSQFVCVVMENKLTGLSHLPLEAPTPTGVEQWYEIFATHPLGRGIDHPLLDPTKFEKALRREVSEKILAVTRYGEHHVERRVCRTDVEYADPVFARLMKHPCTAHCKFRRGDSVFGGFFASEYAPVKDFAYIGWVKWRSDSDESPPRSRNICCSHHAREVLIAAGLMKPAGFEPFVVMSADDAQGTVWDRALSTPVPLPAYTADEAKAERDRRITAHTDKPAGAARQAPKTVEAMKELLEASAKQHGWQPVGKTRAWSTLQQSESFAKVPANWAALLPHVPADVSDESDESPVPACEIVQPAWNTWMVDDQDRSATTSPSRRDLVLAESGYGDWFSVRIAKDKPPRDAKVTQWDHETMSAAQTWPSVIAFAFDLMMSAEQAARNKT